MYTVTAQLNKPFPNVMTEDAKSVFTPNSRWEREYYKVLNMVNYHVESLMKRFHPDDPNTSITVIRELQMYAEKITTWAKNEVATVVYNLNNDTKQKWERHSLLMSKQLREELGKAPIKPLMNQYINDNISLIQSIPLQAAKKIEKIVLENLKAGKKRAESLTDIIMEIGKLPESMRSRAKLIARTEISKMETGLTKARCEALDMNWYVWRSTHDMRVRSSHALMDQVLVAWDNPASPEKLDHQKKNYGHYHPGEIFNCRCYARPLIRVDDVTWPAKVYHGGQIIRMRKADFIRISEGQIPLQ